MKAIVCERYGPPGVLRLEKVRKPLPKDNEVLIKIYATAVNSADWRLRKGEPLIIRLFFGLTKPKRKILGGVFAGEVESVGKAVTTYKSGDAVFGSAGMKFGSYAEYLCLPATGIFDYMPPAFNFEQAAAIPFGATAALYFLRKAKLQPGENMLIYGASGSVGTAAVQLAKHFGTHVTAVCSASNQAMVKALGADEVIDYLSEDFSKRKAQYDIIFNTVGKFPARKSVRALKPAGRLVLGNASIMETLHGGWITLTSKKKVIAGIMRERKEDISWLKNLVDAGGLKPVIDRSYPLEQMADAHEYVEKGHKKGNVVITIDEN